VSLSLGLVASGIVVAVVTSSKGREIRSLLDIDLTFGSFGTQRTIELTDEEIDRLADLASDVFWSALPWLIVVAVTGVVATMWATALVARVTAGRQDGNREPVSLSDEAADALRRVPAVFMSSVAVGAAVMVVVGVCLVPLLVVLASDLAGGAVAVAAVFGLLAALVTAAWLWVRLSLAPVIAAIGGHGLGLRRSWALTHDRVWGVAARLVVLALIAGAVTAPLSLVNSIAPAFGLLTYLVVVVVLQAVSSAAATLIGVPAQVVLVRHLAVRHAPRLGS
jgi:hypothetical protein